MVYCCIQGILVLSCPPRSGCGVVAVHSELSLELDLVWLFFAVISVLVKSKWMSLLDFHLSFCCTEMSLFCYESCQRSPNYGFWTLLIRKFLLIKFLLCLLLLSVDVLSLRNFHKVSVLLDSSRVVSCELLASSDCIPWIILLKRLGQLHCDTDMCSILIYCCSGFSSKIICSFASVVMITIHRVHSAHFH